MKKVDKLADCVGEERVDWVKDILLHAPEYLLDDGLIEELQKLDDENAEDEEWFDDKRIGKWRDFRNSLTKRDMSDMYE